MDLNYIDMKTIESRFAQLMKEKQEATQRCDELNKELEVYKEAFKKMKDLELKKKIAEFILNN